MNVTIRTPDGHDIRAVHETCGAERAVLLCHGIASDKEARGVYTSFARHLAGHGFDSLRFDFRGHGQSTIRPTEASIAGMMIDLLAALDYLHQRYVRVHLLAASFAASVVLLHSRQRTPGDLASVCFWNPVTNYASTFTNCTMPWGRSLFPQGGLRDALRACPIAIPDRTFKLACPMVVELFTLSPEASGWPCETPLLVIHGTDDQLVNPNDSAAFVRTNDRPSVKLLLLDRCGHGLEERTDDAFEHTLGFFQRCR